MAASVRSERRFDPVRQELAARIGALLKSLYPQEDPWHWAARLIGALSADGVEQVPHSHENKWDQSDALVISYGNSVTRKGEAPLRTLHGFLRRHLQGAISGLHLLPFFPYSSDDGFAVINYLQVNDALGDWEDVCTLATDFDLMADLVINHASSRSRWFENFKKRIDPGKDFFVEAHTQDDLSKVVRPRPTPLLQEVQTLGGPRHVWCTFGPDQVDLDFSNPQVLLEFVNIMARYLERGVKILRLDAVAFLWKKPGTSCVHLPQTHEIIQLLRTLAEFKRPDTIVVTETNVPNRENLTYFGNANEAHAIYNFSLPPLLVYALISGDCRHLKTWMMSMPPAQSGTCYLNFIASHDGIGLRPTEGLLSEQELAQMIAAMKAFGGRVSMRAGADGRSRPYEINISLYDAFAGTLSGQTDRWQFQRFLCAHTIMLGLEGIPAIYIHSFLATENDNGLVERSGRNRSINRHVWDAEELERQLGNPGSHHARVLKALTGLLALRRRQPALHPNATQFTLHLGAQLFAFWRQSIDRAQSIFCVSNISDREQRLSLTELNLIGTDRWFDLLDADRDVQDIADELTLAPYESMWITNRVT